MGEKYREMYEKNGELMVFVSYKARPWREMK